MKKTLRGLQKLSSEIEPELNVLMWLCMKNIMRSFYVNYYLTFVLHAFVLFVLFLLSGLGQACIQMNRGRKTHQIKKIKRTLNGAAEKKRR